MVPVHPETGVHTELPFWTSGISFNLTQAALLPFAALDQLLTRMVKQPGIYHMRLFTETYCVNDPRVQGVHYKGPVTLRITSNTGDNIDLDYWTLYKAFMGKGGGDAVRQIMDVSMGMLERQPVLSYRYDSSCRWQRPQHQE